jgi:hypothetical protein
MNRAPGGDWEHLHARGGCMRAGKGLGRALGRLGALAEQPSGLGVGERRGWVSAPCARELGQAGEGAAARPRALLRCGG